MTDDPFGTRNAYETFQKRRNSLFNRSMSSSQSGRSRTYSNSSTSPTQRDFVSHDEYKVCVNVQQFRPNEITVQCIDHLIVVDARHDEREDEFGLVSRQFTRKYQLPKEYNPMDLVSVLNSEGILVIKAPLPHPKEVETIIKVQHIGPVNGGQ